MALGARKVFFPPPRLQGLNASLMIEDEEKVRFGIFPPSVLNVIKLCKGAEEKYFSMIL